MPVKSFIPKFRAEFEDHVRLGRCPFKESGAARGDGDAHAAAAASPKPALAHAD
jgi:hypothetical protein